MIRVKPFLLLIFVIGCGPDPELKALKRDIAALKAENEALREILPIEVPAVMKEVNEAKTSLREIKRELEAVKASVEKIGGQVPPEMAALATMLAEFKESLAVIEKKASMKGHTHEYKDKAPLNTWNSSTRTTEPEK